MRIGAVADASACRTEMATAQRYTHAVDELRRRAAQRSGDILWTDQPVQIR